MFIANREALFAFFAAYITFATLYVTSENEYKKGFEFNSAIDRRFLLSFTSSDVRNRSVTLQSYSYTPKERRQLDFLVVGFPKCGTTTMLKILSRHTETDIPMIEKCMALNSKFSDSVALNRLDEVVGELSPNKHIKRGIKCPSGIKTYLSLERLQRHSPHARLIVGVRHPISFFQSYFNYRVTEVHQRNLSEKIPPPESLIGEKSWKDVSTDAARYDLFLKQLGKTNLTVSQFGDFVGRSHMGVRPNTMKIFLYSLDQIEDKDDTRVSSFRSEIQSFLQLKAPISPFTHENKNQFVGRKGYPETINICESRFSELRNILTRHGSTTEKWVTNEFMKSNEVFVANRDHFLSTIRGWSIDPCIDSENV
jgi:hypothetical protein